MSESTTFLRADLSGARFQLTSFHDASFLGCEFGGTRLHIIEASGVRMTGVEFTDVEIWGDVGNLTVNGVEVGPLVEAELDRRHPERASLRPSDAAGFREAWATVDRLWAATVARARRLDPELLHESVNGEWSFIETQRHLVLVHDGWIARTLRGDPAPFDPLGLPWDDPNPDRPLPPGLTRDRAARPTLDTVLKLRHERITAARNLTDALTDEALDAWTEPNPVDGWPEASAYRVRNVLLHVLGEEWAHHQYATRDLDMLASG